MAYLSPSSEGAGPVVPPALRSLGCAQYQFLL